MAQSPATRVTNTAALIAHRVCFLPEVLPAQTQAEDVRWSELRSFYLGWCPRAAPRSDRCLRIFRSAFPDIPLTIAALLFSLLLSLSSVQLESEAIKATVSLAAVSRCELMNNAPHLLSSSHQIGWDSSRKLVDFCLFKLCSGDSFFMMVVLIFWEGLTDLSSCSRAGLTWLHS